MPIPSGLSIQSTEHLYEGWSRLDRIRWSRKSEDGKVVSGVNEVFDCGNAVAVLLYDTEQQKIILARQFRLAAALNGHTAGVMTEICAGKIEEKSADETMRLEIEQETGYEVTEVRRIMSVYMSPGAVTELVHLYIAPYTPEMKKSPGGGLSSENEHIEVIEIDFEQAIQMIATGEINDAKTIIMIQYARLMKLL